jgi:hypothetical protein
MVLAPGNEAHIGESKKVRDPGESEHCQPQASPCLKNGFEYIFKSGRYTVYKH